MHVLFTEFARRELEDAVPYYEDEHPGLGERFREEIRKGVLRIASHPEAWSGEHGDVRRYLLHKFPYKLLYSIEKEQILILAVAHQHRKPDFWIGRNKAD